MKVEEPVSDGPRDAPRRHVVDEQGVHLFTERWPPSWGSGGQGLWMMKPT
jgi:hypothetical protein